MHLAHLGAEVEKATDRRIGIPSIVRVRLTHEGWVIGENPALDARVGERVVELGSEGNEAARVGTGDDILHQRHVREAARQGTLGGGDQVIAVRCGRDAPEGRLESIETAEGGRNPDRAAHVRPRGQRAETGGQRGG